MALQHLRSSTADKRPTPAAMAEGQLALNTNLASPGLFFKDSNGDLVKVGPVHVGTTAPNATPASGGQSGNSKGEQWLDTSSSRYVFKIWDGSAWRSEDGEFVNASGDTMTGALGIIAGSAASPSVFISGDTNTGIYSPGADQLAISTNGTGRLFVDASGNVGVGTTSPGSVLEAKSADQNPNIFRLYNAYNAGASSWGVDFYRDTDSGNNQAVAEIKAIRTGGNPSDLKFGTSTTPGTVVERLRITSDGKLGVGTGDPQSFVTLNGGTGSGFTDVLQLSAGTNASNSGPGLTFNANFNNYSISKNWQTGVIRSAGSNAAANYQGYLAFYTNNGSTAGDVTEKLRITHDGKLGLGTSSPDANSQLHIVSSSYQPLYVNTTSAGGGGAVFLQSGTQALYTGTAGATWLTGSATTDGLVRAEANLIFATNGNTRAVTIDSSQRVGIGTTSAGTRLHVSGTQGDNSTLYITSTDLGAGNGGIISIGGAYDGSGNTTAFTQIKALKDNASVGDYGGSLAFFNRAGAGGLTEKARIDSSGRLLVGTSTSVAVDSAGTTFNSELQVAGSSASVTIARSVGSGNLFLARNQTVNDGSPLGFIGFQGGDGTNLIQAASIQGIVDGTPGSNDMPGRLVFSTTADGASSPTERMRISANGTVEFKNAIKETVYTLGTSGSIALNPSNGSIQTSVLTGAPTFTDSLEAGQTIVLMLEGGASYSVTWPTTTWVTSAGNVAPTLTAKDTLVFWKVSTTLYGAYVGSYV